MYALYENSKEATSKDSLFHSLLLEMDGLPLS